MLCLFTAIADAQISVNLNMKVGLEYFQFDSSEAFYKNQIIRDTDAALLFDCYLVVDSSLKRVFNYDAQKIDLFFKDNKLYFIDIYFPRKKDNDDYARIIDSVSSLFGDPIDGEILYSELPPAIIAKKTWKGTNTSLDLLDFNDPFNSSYFVSIEYYKVRK